MAVEKMDFALGMTRVGKDTEHISTAASLCASALASPSCPCKLQFLVQLLTDCGLSHNHSQSAVPAVKNIWIVTAHSHDATGPKGHSVALTAAQWQKLSFGSKTD